MPLKFKQYTWPHNPTTFQMGYQKRVINHEYPEIDGAEVEELGSGARVFSGSGVFYGKNAYKDFSMLVRLYYEKTPGLLVHPKWAPAVVKFTKLDAKEEPLPDYVEYTFEFVEHKDITLNIVPSKPIFGGGNNSSGKTTNNTSKKHKVIRGETLWDISKKYYGKGSDWKKIANANKNLIKDPNLIQPGWVLIIP